MKNQMYEPRRNRAKWNLIKVLYIMSAEKRETLQILPNCKFWKGKAYKPAINQAENWIHSLLAEVSYDEENLPRRERPQLAENWIHDNRPNFNTLKIVVGLTGSKALGE